MGWDRERRITGLAEQLVEMKGPTPGSVRDHLKGITDRRKQDTHWSSCGFCMHVRGHAHLHPSYPDTQSKCRQLQLADLHFCYFNILKLLHRHSRCSIRYPSGKLAMSLCYTRAKGRWSPTHLWYRLPPVSQHLRHTSPSRATQHPTVGHRTHQCVFHLFFG